MVRMERKNNLLVRKAQPSVTSSVYIKIFIGFRWKGFCVELMVTANRIQQKGNNFNAFRLIKYTIDTISLSLLSM